MSERNGNRQLLLLSSEQNEQNMTMTMMMTTNTKKKHQQTERTPTKKPKDEISLFLNKLAVIFPYFMKIIGHFY